MGDVVPRNEITKQGMRGVGGIAGGVAILIVRALATNPVGGVIVGALVGVLGLVMLKDKSDRKAGLVALGIGAATAAAFVLPGIKFLSLGLLMVAGIGLLGFGAWSLLKFFRNLKRQS